MHQVWPLRDVAQFSSVEEEGLTAQGHFSPPTQFLPLLMTREGGESLGHLLVKPHQFVFLENSFWWDPKHRCWHGADFFTHGRAPSWRRNGGVQVGLAAVDAVIVTVIVHFNRTVRAGEPVGRGRCFSACTLPQPTPARPRWVQMLHVLIGFWFVRSGKNIF